MEEDTYQWGDAEHTTVMWTKADDGITWHVPTAETPYIPTNSDWIRIKDLLEQGLITIADPLPTPLQPEVVNPQDRIAELEARIAALEAAKQ